MIFQSKQIIALVLCLVFGCVTEAAPRKHWFTDPKWWAGEAAIAAAIVADSHSTASRPPGAVESNWLLGRNPSNRKVALVSLGYFGIQTSLHAAAWHVTHHVPLADGSGYAQDRLGYRAVGYLGVPFVVGILSGHAAARNYELK